MDDVTSPEMPESQAPGLLPHGDPATSSPLPPDSFAQDLRHVASGFLMGSADIIPGVSGGTVALIVGVYERLVSAISQCNTTFVQLLLSGSWKAAARHIDLRFVMALGCGIAVGIGGLASLMNHLLMTQMSLMFATFSGMILASSVLVARRIPDWKMQHAGVFLLGVIFALRVMTLPALQNPPDTLWYMALCGMVGITAMILPGISGAFILLLLNRYHDITEGIRAILQGQWSVATFLSLGVFAAGCVAGLLSFSRILKWLLFRYHDSTMAVLCGFMVGSLYRLWPFQREVGFAEKFKYKVFEHYLPESFGGSEWTAVLLFALGTAVVLGLDAFASRHNRRQ